MPSTPMTFGSQMNFQKIPILGIVPESASSAPSSPVAGQLWLDTSLTPARLKVYENGAFTLVSELTSVQTTDSAGGDLSGTFSNLQIAANAVGTTEINNAAVTYAKIQNVTAARLLGNPTGGAAAPSEISLSSDLAFSGSALQTAAFTGDVTKSAGGTATTIAANAVTLAKLATAVSLSGIASTNASTADITASGFKITNLGTPTNAADAATKAYVDATATGLDIKASVRIASTANQSGTYTATGGTSARGQFTAMSNAAIDGVTPAAGNRVLLKNQSTGAQNGIWVITTLGSGANGVWDRATDFDEDAEVTAGAFMFVEEGTTNADTGWVLQTNNPIIIGGASGTSLAFTQFNGAGSYIAGNGLTLTGNTFDVVGTTNRISVAADSIDISASYVGQSSITTLGTITTGVWTGTAIAAVNGGTGQTVYAVGDLLYASSTTALSKLTIGATGTVLHGGTTPSWSAVSLTADVGSSILPIANGGTNATSAAAARTSLGITGGLKYSATLGAMTAGSETTVTHSLGTTEVLTMFRDATTNYQIIFSWRVIDANSIGLTPDINYSGSAVKVVVVG